MGEQEAKRLIKGKALHPMRRPLLYILVDKEPVPLPPESSEENVLRWAAWMEEAWKSGENQVARTIIGDYRVSTVFLGMDHAHGFGVPIVFETMIFYRPNETRKPGEWLSHPFEDYQRRYATWDEAVAGHTRAVDAVLADNPVIW